MSRRSCNAGGAAAVRGGDIHGGLRVSFSSSGPFECADADEIQFYPPKKRAGPGLYEIVWIPCSWDSNTIVVLCSTIWITVSPQVAVYCPERFAEGDHFVVREIISFVRER